IGGFSGEPSGELFTRWIQFGVFSPFMRAHSAGDTAEREPWSFGEEYENLNRKFIELRYKLLPYIYTVFWEQYRYGLPILRPLIMLEQHLIGNLQREEEFAFGDKILISPVLEAGQQIKTIYLPHGYWYNYWTNELIEGGMEHQFKTPIDEMPIFIKAGTVLPEYPVMQYVTEKWIDELSINIFYTDSDLESTIYEDHGDSFAFEQQVYLEKKFKVKGTGLSLEIKQETEGLYTESYQYYNLKIIGLPFELKN